MVTLSAQKGFQVLRFSTPVQEQEGWEGLWTDLGPSLDFPHPFPPWHWEGRGGHEAALHAGASQRCAAGSSEEEEGWGGSPGGCIVLQSSAQLAKAQTRLFPGIFNRWKGKLPRNAEICETPNWFQWCLSLKKVWVKKGKFSTREKGKFNMRAKENSKWGERETQGKRETQHEGERKQHRGKRKTQHKGKGKVNMRAKGTQHEGKRKINTKEKRKLSTANAPIPKCSPGKGGCATAWSNPDFSRRNRNWGQTRDSEKTKTYQGIPEFVFKWLF